MKIIALAAVFAAGLAAPALAADHGGWGGGHDHSKHGFKPAPTYKAAPTYHAAPTYSAPRGPKIVVSCYRGPKKKIWWDKPNAVFVDSLVAAGYDRATAKSVAYSICRNPAYVGNLGAAVSGLGRGTYKGGGGGGYGGY